MFSKTKSVLIDCDFLKTLQRTKQQITRYKKYDEQSENEQHIKMEEYSSTNYINEMHNNGLTFYNVIYAMDKSGKISYCIAQR